PTSSFILGLWVGNSGLQPENSPQFHRVLVHADVCAMALLSGALTKLSQPMGRRRQNPESITKQEFDCMITLGRRALSCDRKFIVHKSLTRNSRGDTIS